MDATTQRLLAAAIAWGEAYNEERYMDADRELLVAITAHRDLDRLAQLHDDDLHAVVAAVEQAIMLGDGWLQRTADGTLHARQTRDVILTERTA